MTIDTLPHVFEQTVSGYGNRPAIRYKKYGIWQDVSWNRYFQLSGYAAAGLMAIGLKKGDRVSIIGNNCPEWIIISMGIQRAGGITTGIYATNAWSQIAYVIEQSDSSFFFVENEEQLDKWLHFKESCTGLKKVIVWDLEGLKAFDDPMVCTYAELLDQGRRLLEEKPDCVRKRSLDIQPDDVSMLIYTSGTTGRPKGAMLTHRNLMWMGRTIVKDNPIYDTDEVLSFLPLCHVFEQLFSVMGHINCGYIVNFIEGLDTVSENMTEVSPTVGYAVPRIWEKYHSGILIRMSDATWFKRTMFHLALKIGRIRITRQVENKPSIPGWELLYKLAHALVFRKLKERLGFDRLRFAYSGAAPISPEVLIFLQSIGVNLMEGYGQTEGTGVTCCTRIDDVKFGTVGRPLTGVEVKIGDDGEILVKSPGVFKGYYNNPGATADALKDEWLYSGDVGSVDGDGYLTITDRKKDIIVTAGGKNITPQLVENRLKFSPYINDAVIVGDKRKYLVCLVMIDEENVVKYAQDEKVQFFTYKDLTRHPTIIQLIQSEVDEVNQSLSRVEQVKKFRILPKKLYEEDGEVTPTMKVKRQYVNEAFKELIDTMYNEQDR